ncbi:MAG TPA: WS/DGAT domain-containing protein [Myxococcota bacterium]|nr:WS/DGAT domain-containing protein [Myxococcota bacterium]
MLHIAPYAGPLPAQSTGVSLVPDGASIRRRRRAGPTPGHQASPDGWERRAAPHREPLDAGSRMWLGYRHAIVPAVVEFEGPVTREHVLDLVYERLLAMPRFSQRLVPSRFGGAWEEVPDFDPRDHVRAVTLPSPGTYDDERALLGSLYHRPQDATRPLWDMAVVEREGRGSLLLVRIHHALSDGMGLVDAALRCADGRPADLLPTPPSRPPRAATLAAAAHTAWGAGWGFARTALDLVTRRPDPPSCIKRGEDPERMSFAWLREPWRLDDLKAVADRLGGGTVNDVLLTVLTGALRAHLRAQGEPVDVMQLHCELPIYLPARRARGEAALGNHIGAARCVLPVDEADPRAAFAAVRACMLGVKRGFEPTLLALLMRLLGCVPARLGSALRRYGSQQVSAFVSNVYGPPRPVSLTGHAVADLRWLGGQGDNVGVFVAVISYGEHLNVGISSDAAVVPDAQVLIDRMAEAYAPLRQGLASCGDAVSAQPGDPARVEGPAGAPDMHAR